MHQLILLLKELESLSRLCNRCGMCQAACPLFRETGHESDVARGKLSLLNGLISEILTKPENVLERLNKCLLCGSCEARCPRQVKTTEIFIKARIAITGYTGLSFFKKTILQHIVARPLLFDKTAQFLSKYQHLFFKSSDKSGKALKSRLLTPLSKERTILPVSPHPFHTLDKPALPDREFAFKVIFFTGCLIDKFMPDIGLACMKALDYHNVKVSFLKEEGCCGMPALSAGDIHSFNRLADYNAELFSGKESDFILTACATCTFTIKKLWPLIYSGRNPELIKEISSKTMDITEFISRNFSDELQKPAKIQSEKPAVVTLHDPCHLKKSFGIAKEPRELIKSSPYHTLKEMTDADSCCGFGGSFNLSYYKLSSAIGAKKCSTIEETKASIVATGCPACIIQLKDQLAKKESAVKVKHIMELYAESLK